MTMENLFQKMEDNYRKIDINSVEFSRLPNIEQLNVIRIQMAMLFESTSRRKISVPYNGIMVEIPADKNRKFKDLCDREKALVKRIIRNNERNGFTRNSIEIDRYLSTYLDKILKKQTSKRNIEDKPIILINPNFKEEKKPEIDVDAVSKALSGFIDEQISRTKATPTRNFTMVFAEEYEDSLKEEVKERKNGIISRFKSLFAKRSRKNDNPFAVHEPKPARIKKQKRENIIRIEKEQKGGMFLKPQAKTGFFKSIFSSSKGGKFLKKKEKTSFFAKLFSPKKKPVTKPIPQKPKQTIQPLPIVASAKPKKSFWERLFPKKEKPIITIVKATNQSSKVTETPEPKKAKKSFFGGLFNKKNKPSKIDKTPVNTTKGNNQTRSRNLKVSIAAVAMTAVAIIGFSSAKTSEAKASTNSIKEYSTSDETFAQKETSGITLESRTQDHYNYREETQAEETEVLETQNETYEEQATEYPDIQIIDNLTEENPQESTTFIYTNIYDAVTESNPDTPSIIGDIDREVRGLVFVVDGQPKIVYDYERNSNEKIQEYYDQGGYLEAVLVTPVGENRNEYEGYYDIDSVIYDGDIQTIALGSIIQITNNDLGTYRYTLKR